MTSYPFFSRWRPVDLSWVMLDHPRSTIVGVSSILEFGLDPIYNFGIWDIAIFIFGCFGLKLPIPAHFFWEGGIFPPNMVAYCSNPQKALPYAETRHLTHKAWKSVQRFDLGAFPRKKVQDRTVEQESHKVVIFRPYGEKPPLYRLEPKFARWVAFPT